MEIRGDKGRRGRIAKEGGGGRERRRRKRQSGANERRKWREREG